MREEEKKNFQNKPKIYHYGSNKETSNVEGFFCISMNSSVTFFFP